MRVPGNERAFTVSPARGIPFPQLVCIGAAAVQSQAFPVSARARLTAAGSWNWPARPRRRRRALLYAASAESPRLPRPPRSPRAPASTHAHAHAHTHTFARGPALVRTAALRLCTHAQSRGRPPGAAVRSGATGGRGLETEDVEGEEAGWPRDGWGRAPCRERPRGRRPAGRRRPSLPGDAAAAERLPGPAPEPRGGPRPCAATRGRASASSAWVGFGREGAGGPRAEGRAAERLRAAPEPGGQQ